MSKIAFFLRSPKFTSDWSTDEEAVPLSGTDSTTLYLINTVKKSGRFKVVLLGKDPPRERDPEFHFAQTLPEAFMVARAAGARRMIFNGASTQEIRAMQSLPGQGPELVMWAHNSPGFGLLSAAFNIPQSLRIVAVSDLQRQGFNYHPIYRRTISIPNPAPERKTWLEPAGIKTGSPRQICYIGALKLAKGFHHLAKIWPRFRAAHPDVSLAVCGSSSLYDPRARRGAAGLSDNDYEREILGCLGGSQEAAQTLGVSFLGSLTKEDLRRTIRQSLFAVVNPNLTGSTETFCCSAVEAQCLGVPVVGARIGALRETVGHEIGGLLFRTHDEFLPYMSRLTQDDELRLSLAKRGFEHVTTAYDRQTVAARWLDFLDGKPLPPFAGNIREWVTLADHVRCFQRLFPLQLGAALRRLKSR